MHENWKPFIRKMVFLKVSTLPLYNIILVLVAPLVYATQITSTSWFSLNFSGILRGLTKPPPEGNSGCEKRILL